MQMTSAALLCAAAMLPALAHATTTIPDPTDAAASVPAASVPSAFEGYQPYRDGEGPTWQQLNQTVMGTTGMAGMKQKQPAASTPAKNIEPGTTHSHNEGAK